MHRDYFHHVIYLRTFPGVWFSCCCGLIFSVGLGFNVCFFVVAYTTLLYIKTCANLTKTIFPCPNDIWHWLQNHHNTHIAKIMPYTYIPNVPTPITLNCHWISLMEQLYKKNKQKAPIHPHSKEMKPKYLHYVVKFAARICTVRTFSSWVCAVETTGEVSSLLAPTPSPVEIIRWIW